MRSNDNWGYRARFGIFIVGNEAVPEAEWWAMAPEGVSIHAARISAKAPWAAWRGDRTEVDLCDDLARAAAQFATMRLDAVVVAHTSSSIVGGEGWDEAIVRRLSSIIGNGPSVTTNGQDSLEALRHVSARRPFLVLPPWFPPDTVTAALRYYEDHDVVPAGHLRIDPGRQWRDLPPGELYKHGLGFEQDVESLYRQIRAACPAEADGIFIAGTGFRCVAILRMLENDLRRPVLSANQVSLWRCLRLAGIRTTASDYGALLGPDPSLAR
ncbi:MAG: hypothetical protein FJX57_00485 [Alphaproteobacteria bacterium]|nr:hypothetical protein [Alphaproteobacteria bacterium]